ncbi:MAG TPA: TolC family protein [Anaeromyxobacter sp.]
MATRAGRAPGRAAPILFRLCLAALLAGPAVAARAQAPDALTLDDVLREAHASNARLPIPATDLLAAREKVSEARAERWLKVAVEGDFIYAPPNGYDPAITNAGEFRLQAVGRQPLYDGGAKRAAVLRGEADADAAGARYRIAEKDVELDVRSRYAEWAAADSEAAARSEGIDRLQRYRSLLQSRRASGQGVGADVLKTDVRLATERASLVDAEGRRESARIALNALMGRDPSAPLRLVSLPLPSTGEPPALPAGAPPEVAEAEAATRSAAADVATARAEAKPHLNLQGDVGFLGSDTSRWVPADLLARDPNATFGDRVRRDTGYSLALTFTWNVFDFGAIRARIRQAELKLASAKQNVVWQTQEARRQRAQAESTLANVREQIRILSDAAPSARDAYLEAESRYRGGAATAFEVLEAYAASVDAAVKLGDALSRWRIAQALAARWGSP